MGMTLHENDSAYVLLSPRANLTNRCVSLREAIPSRRSAVPLKDGSRDAGRGWLLALCRHDAGCHCVALAPCSGGDPARQIAPVNTDTAAGDLGSV